MILDTTVLVDLQRELRRNAPGGATAILERYADEPTSITFVTWAEFAEGFDDGKRAACERFPAPFPVLWPDADVSWETSRIARRLASEGQPIGDHDAWIAGFGRRLRRPVVTRNRRHFARVSGLEVREY